MRGVYWIKTDKYTYVIPNYAKANAVGIQWWLYLTVGGQTKISIDSARTMHVIDDEGKDRKVHIIQRVANEPPKPRNRAHDGLRLAGRRGRSQGAALGQEKKADSSHRQNSAGSE